MEKKFVTQKRTGECRLLLPICLFFAALFCGSVFAAETIVARVGSAPITEKELEAAIDIYVPKGGFHGAVSKEKRDEYRKPALDWLIEKELLFQEAKRRGLKATSAEIDAVVKFNEDRFGSKKAFRDALKSEGKTMPQFRNSIERETLISKLAGTEIVEKAAYSDEELKDYYEKNINKFKRPDSLHIWHILISAAPEMSDEERGKKKALAQEVLAKIRAGEDFSSAADRHSEDAYRVKGGDMGYIHRGRLVEEVEDVAFSLKEGQVSDVIESIFGFHIIKAGGRKEAETIGFDEAKSKLRMELEQKRYEDLRTNYIHSLKEKTAVRIY